MTTKIRLTLPKLHDAQVLVASSKTRHRVVSCGRRWGKTMVASGLSLQEAAAGGRVWWIAPSHSQAMEGWNYACQIARQLPGVQIMDGTKVLKFPGGGLIEFKTADDQDKLRGSGLDLVVFDECSAIHKPGIWEEVMHASLAERKGRALFLSTPRGRNWFFDLYNLGASSEHKDWESWSFPTGSNPHIPKSAIEDARRDLPKRVFLQEWEAKFLEGTGIVFENTEELATALIDERGGSGYFAFVDMAEKDDFTAIAIFKEENGIAVQVHADRWNQTGWEITRPRVVAAMTRFKGTWGFDRTGKDMDSSFVQDLRSYNTGCSIVTEKFNRANKPAMIENLIVRLANKTIKLLRPDQCEAAEAQALELVIYTATTGASHYVKYSAPPGGHDDTVVAIYGALWLLREAWSDEEIDRNLRNLGRVMDGLYG